ncbi:class I SAM-dependent DNA methyltransferase [Miniphocaeibacter massiliensis]|uniref:class I SAM-dependent DNA methyltransferase n=1 Tax=Miniphocaeibacter massiliensis TaxID=2041841 RepID=UPI000C075143|nr:class I SAM-dependent methyltransferase [Miniphocaeibacter massiliensis]
MLEKIIKLSKKPSLYEKSESKFWDDSHISKEMLKAHLNKEVESATRKLEFVKKSVNWISEVLPKEKYKEILDLGCGPGIYCELLKERGYKVTGVDLSRNSINYAIKSAKEKRLDINYIVADYLEWKFPKEKNLITMIYCDFGVLSTKERKTILNKIYNSLDEEGVFLFDVFTPIKNKNKSEFKNWSVENKGFWSDKPYLLLESFYKYEKENTFLNQYIVSTSKKTDYYNIWEHTFEIEELIEELEKAGFSNIEIYKNVAGEKYFKDSKTMCLLARKNKC